MSLRPLQTHAAVSASGPTCRYIPLVEWTGRLHACCEQALRLHSALTLSSRGHAADFIRRPFAGHLGAAVLDVCSTEPLPAASKLWCHPNVRITPHVSSLTNMDTAIEQIVENYQRFLLGQQMRNLVDRDAGY
jgi:hypothetical protein